jgi:hypothetical protein
VVLLVTAASWCWQQAVQPAVVADPSVSLLAQVLKWTKVATSSFKRVKHPEVVVLGAR